MLLKSIRLKNLLSFTDAELSLKPLNILIGANASGKTNLLSAIELLRAAPQGPSGLARLIPEGGGIVEWISKFAPPGAIAELEATFELPGRANVLYSLALGERPLILHRFRTAVRIRLFQAKRL